MIQSLHANRAVLTQRNTMNFNNTDSWTHTYTLIGLCRLKACRNEVTFKWVSINKSVEPFNRLCPVSVQYVSDLSAGALTKRVIALLQINISLNI